MVWFYDKPSDSLKTIMSLPKFIKATGIYYPRELETFKRKKGTYLQPIFEAVTNAWEAIIDKFGSDNLDQGKITISFETCTE